MLATAIPVMQHRAIIVNGLCCMPGQNPLLDAALFYASIGWRVMPLQSVVDISSDANHPQLRCTCRNGTACKTPGKHPRIKTGPKYAAATTDPATITAWWRRWPNANIGIATGHAPGTDPSIPALCVVDIDGPRGAHTLVRAIREAGLTELPRTLTASSGRPDGGMHLYYLSEVCPQSSGDGLDSRGDGGLVVAPPSRHVSGATYGWTDPTPPAPLPPALAGWLDNRDRPSRPRKPRPELPSVLPAHLQGRKSTAVNAILKKNLHPPPPPADVVAALKTIANPDLGWDAWNRILMAAYASSPTPEVLDACIFFSRKSTKYQEGACEERWRAYATSPPTDLSFGTLVELARHADSEWEAPSRQMQADLGDDATSRLPPSRRPQLEAGADSGIQAEISGASFPFPGNSRVSEEPQEPHGHVNGHNGHSHLPVQLTQETPENPLIDLNKSYSVIGNIGGKCLVLSWVQSREDASILIPSFQKFTDFRDRYSSRYVKALGDEKSKELGKTWLTWRGRKTYDGIDVAPNEPEILPGNILNLWRGFSCAPAPGRWDRMRDHITDVLANGDAEHAEYILKYAAWAVQNPGSRAEVALVFRGGKGSGKGTFAGIMKRIFGQHGLQIFNSKHLTGSFNGHLRNCLLLFADEAFWAGDRQGESVLKGMLTEPTLMVEQKGVDATPWRNRLHVIMAANAEWVVPASHDERRYAMFDVSNKRIRDHVYFEVIHYEMAHEGGLAAMLYDLLAVPLGKWHPRKIVHTSALQAQKARSLDPMHEWFESLLQQGELPIAHTPTAEYVCSAGALLNMVREAGGRHSHNITANALGRFLRKWECVALHRSQGSAWRFPSLQKLRELWEIRYGKWIWDVPLKMWNERNN